MPQAPGTAPRSERPRGDAREARRIAALRARDEAAFTETLDAPAHAFRSHTSKEDDG